MQTYDDILARMAEKYREISGNTPAEASDIYVRLQVLAGELYSAYMTMEWLKRQMFVPTAGEEYLDLHAMERGLTRREASKAVGSVIFSVSEPAIQEINIPKGTVVATNEEYPLRFETVESVSIPIGALSVHAQIQALSEGRAYNVKAGKITVMVTPVAGVQSVTNPDECTAGTDRESDENLRDRVIESFKFASNGTNCAYYKTIATEVEGVAGAGVMPRGRGAGTVDVYISAEGSEVSDETLEAVQSKLSQLREVNVDVAVYRAEPERVDLMIYLDVCDGYEFTQVAEECKKIVTDYISTRGVGDSVVLSRLSDKLYHTEGVADFRIVSSGGNTNCSQNSYPVAGNIRVYEGV